MAPTKKDAKDGEKEAKLTPEQSAALIMDYLRKQNRPYSATDISTNLKNRVTKSAAAKLLKDMHERKEIEGRAAGKQLVYHTIQVRPTSTRMPNSMLIGKQVEADDNAVEKLQAMDVETTRLQVATRALKTEEAELRNALKEGASQIPMTEVRGSVAALEHEKAEMIARLTKLKSGSVQPVNTEERDKVNSEHRKLQKTAGARKKIRNELWRAIKDALSSKEELEELREQWELDL